ncbi:MAG: flagellar hook protein [Ruminiclostridium sp.]|nr:flagellar hook protein [Ruminiclostridium sp.]
MRSQIRGLTQASANANDAISLIQTAEGGLQETEDIMQRMRELSVQSANGTYTDEDREQIQYEVDALKAEVDRIAESTEYNEMKLLDGSLDGKGSSNGEYGARYGTQIEDADNKVLNKGSTITSNIAGVTVEFTENASGKGGENAFWNDGGTALTINLVKGQSYSQNEIDELVKGANTAKDDAQSANIPDVKITLEGGRTKSVEAQGASDETAAGVRAASEGADGNLSAALVGDKTEGYADTIKFTANSYGKDEREIKIAFDVAAGKEEVKVGEQSDTDDFTKDGKFELHLATGTDYSEDDIERILAKAGLDYSVSLTDSNAPDGDAMLRSNSKEAEITETIGDGAEGKGVGKDAIQSTGEGLTFQIGANGVEDQRLTVNVGDMSADALGIGGLSVAKQDDANEAINKLDDAIKTVSTQRAKLGAVQNRLEHTVNSLNTANENMTASESQIRDTDMAAEMIKYTKSNILQQASQSMLAQANQQPQGVLQLLG